MEKIQTTRKSLPRRIAVAMVVVIAGVGMTPAGADDPHTSELRLNHVQMIGTHNSYHQAPIVAARPSADYSHLPLQEQLDGGVRSLELDVHYRGLPQLLVYHSDPDDNRSSCPTLESCLGEIAAWSDTNRNHHALLVMIEAKTGFNEFPEPLGKEQRRRALADLEESLVAFDGKENSRIVTPDYVRGHSDTLREALDERGWPTVTESRGKVVFFLLAPPAVRQEYLQLHPRLQGAKTFLLLNDPADQNAAIASHGNPLDPNAPAAIAAALQATMLVRTRADAGLGPDSERAASAFSSGAHIVATDFPFADNYLKVRASRCNPVTAPSWCDDSMIEPRRLTHEGQRSSISRTAPLLKLSPT